MAQRAEHRSAPADRECGLADAPKTGALADALTAGGLAVLDGFVPPPLVRGLIDCAHRRRDRGEFQAARIGTQRQLRLRERIRGDHTCWLEEPVFAEERTLLHELEQVRLRVNRAAYLGLFDIEIHYAWYPPGAGYARHVDQLQDRHQRVVSVILYLNEDWERGSGGELRIFEPRGHRDIEPVAGRLVCFLCDGLEHAVLPTVRDRLSITGWFRRRVSA